MLVVDDHPSDRLRAVAALAGRFDVIPLPTGEDPLRAARGHRPELVLLSLGHGAADGALRACRTLRTDVRPIEHVAVYVHGRPPRTVQQVCETWRADGYLAGDFDGPALLAFAESVLRGEAPVRVPDVSAGPLARLVGRLRGRR